MSDASALELRSSDSDRALAAVWERVRGLVLDRLRSENSRRAYARALEEFRGWSEVHGSGFTRETVRRYRIYLEGRGMAASSMNVQLSAIRKLAEEAAAIGLLTREQAVAVQEVEGVRQKGQRTGTWLTLDQAEQLLQAPGGAGLRAVRDRGLLGVMVGCGLRRQEVAALTVETVQQREGRWVLVDLRGKGGRIRSVPMPAWSKMLLDAWMAAAGIGAGRLFRGIGQTGELGEGLTAQAVYLIVRRYAKQLGWSVAPHDLRRTFAKLAHRGRAPLEQIQLSLGHESILTTERYLGIRQSLTDAPCDHLGIRLDSVGSCMQEPRPHQEASSTAMTVVEMTECHHPRE